MAQMYADALVIDDWVTFDVVDDRIDGEDGKGGAPYEVLFPRSVGEGGLLYMKPDGRIQFVDVPGFLSTLIDNPKPPPRDDEDAEGKGAVPAVSAVSTANDTREATEATAKALESLHARIDAMEKASAAGQQERVSSIKSLAEKHESLMKVVEEMEWKARVGQAEEATSRESSEEAKAEELAEERRRVEEEIKSVRSAMEQSARDMKALDAELKKAAQKAEDNLDKARGQMLAMCVKLGAEASNRMRVYKLSGRRSIEEARETDILMWRPPTAPGSSPRDYFSVTLRSKALYDIRVRSAVLRRTASKCPGFLSIFVNDKQSATVPLIRAEVGQKGAPASVTAWCEVVDEDKPITISARFTSNDAHVVLDEHNTVLSITRFPSSASVPALPPTTPASSVSGPAAALV